MVKISIIQFAPVLGEPDTTIDKLSGLLGQITDSQIIALPELANSGYNFSSREEALKYSEESNDSRFLDFLISQCQEKKCFIVTGFNERDGNELFSSSVLLGPEGVKVVYRKIHLFWNEKDIFSKGNRGLPVVDLGFAKVGMLVCFDWVFPEVWRVLALKGADIIFHPSNIVLPYAQKVVPSYSITNRIFVALINRVGTEKNLTFTGKSLLTDPAGDILCSASEDKEEILSVEIDPSNARNKMMTPRNHLFDDRRVEDYRFLVPPDPLNGV